MATESESEPRAPRRPPRSPLNVPDHPPEGWREDATGAWVLLPDETYERSIEDDRRNLAESPCIAEEVARLRSYFWSLHSEFFSRNPVDQIQLRELVYTTTRLQLWSAAERCSPEGAPSWSVFAYLFAQTIHARHAAELGLNWWLEGPVHLRFNPLLGEFTMTFSDATGRERERLDTPISQLQKVIGYRPPRPGPTKRPTDKTKAEQAKTAAKLHHWLGLTEQEIADFFGWQGADKARRERARTYLRDGETLIAAETENPDWKSDPPEKIDGLFKRPRGYQKDRKEKEEE